MKIKTDILVATLRECWVLAENLRASATERCGQFATKSVLPALVLETIRVHEPHQRQGHCRRFIEEICGRPGFEIFIVEAVGNKDLAAALMRWGWDFDAGVMDFYRRTEQP